MNTRKKCFIFTCHPSYMVCWWVLVHSGWDFTWKLLWRGHLRKKNTYLSCILDPRSLLVQILNEILAFVILNGSQKSGNRHPEGLSLYMGMFLCIREESSSYSLWNQKKKWSLSFHLWMFNSQYASFAKMGISNQLSKGWFNNIYMASLKGVGYKNQN
jgi:hypothetical protein